MGRFRMLILSVHSGTIRLKWKPLFLTPDSNNHNLLINFNQYNLLYLKYYLRYRHLLYVLEHIIFS